MSIATNVCDAAATVNEQLRTIIIQESKDRFLTFFFKVKPDLAVNFRIFKSFFPPEIFKFI
jgi:hypothetical protein